MIGSTPLLWRLGRCGQQFALPLRIAAAVVEGLGREAGSASHLGYTLWD
jgi:hypothetical protein